jgi:Fe-S-cluster containining protein
MLLKFDPNVSYECVQCGKGCFNAWDIHVEAPVVERMKGHVLELRVIQERGSAFLVDGDGFRINKGDDHPRCGFLNEEMLCGIHADTGYESKPLTCQQYPYLLVQTPDGKILVSAAYSCTAVSEDIGPPLSQSQPEIEALIARGGRVHKLDAGRIEILPPWVAAWTEVAEYEDELQTRLTQGTYGSVLLECIAGLARYLASQPQAAEETVLPYGALRQSLRLAAEVGAGARSQLSLIKMILTMGLLKPCLFTTDREVWRKIDEAVLGDADLDLPDFNWKAPLQDLELWVNDGVGNQFDGEILRFQKSLFFRKAHLTMGGLLPGLILVWVKPTIIRLLTGLYAWKNERQPGLEDFRWALERAETRLVAHTFDTVPVYQRAAWQAVAVCGPQEA